MDRIQRSASSLGWEKGRGCRDGGGFVKGKENHYSPTIVREKALLLNRFFPLDPLMSEFRAYRVVLRK